MISKGLLVAAAAVAATAAIVTPQTADAAQAAPVSQIYSAAQNTCLDTSTIDPAKYFLDIYGHSCDGSTAQAFAFHPLSTGPAGTYEITNQATGQCLDRFRFGIRQESCTGAVPPDLTNAEWTLQPVGTTGNSYRFVFTGSVGNPTPTCVMVLSTPNGYPGPLFNLKPCSSDPAQILTLSTAP